MRRIVTFLIFLLAFLTPVYHAVAQGFVPAGAPPWVYADNFGRWAIQGQNANTYTFQASGKSPCYFTKLNFGDSSTFYAFGNGVALAPVFVQDNNSANSEVVTPGSYLVPTQSSCGPAIAPVNPHTTFSLQSGTGGLQEAINTVGGFTAPYPVEIFLTPEWYKLVAGIAGSNSTLAAITPATIKAAAKGSKNAILVDITTAPPTQYVWLGTAYASGTQYWTSVPPPAIAAGAGAGTGPTIALAAGSNAVSGTVNLTSGTTPTASATIFTLTWNATAGIAGTPTNNWGYAPTCTVTSTGTPAYTGTNAVTGTTGAIVDTYTATATALAASTAGYSWTYLCH
jgi:hypothetical protein